MQLQTNTKRLRGFSLVELLVVIFVITVLISILIPVVSKVRQSVYRANVQNQIAQLSAAIERYHQDMSAYPGPLANDEVYLTTNYTSPSFTSFACQVQNGGTGFETNWTGGAGQKITGAENLVLGLAGGLRVDRSNNRLIYDPSIVGKGPMALSTAGMNKIHPAYIDANDLSWHEDNGQKTGDYHDAGGAADDSIIPEILDRFPARMPILYLRARVGADAAVSVIRGCSNAGVPIGSPQQYDLKDIYGYTSAPIGEGRRLKGTVKYAPGTNTSDSGTHHGLQTVIGPPTPSTLDKGTPTSYYPYDAYAYFESPQVRYSAASPRAQARAKDTFILISAGPDRVYGTEDDITSFGSVLP